MPFRRRLLTDPMPSRDPDVDIIFHGQILLRSVDGVTCQAAINPLATNHVLSIEARTKVPNQSDVIRMRHVGPLNYRRPEGLLIDVNPVADPAVAWACVTKDLVDYAGGTGNSSDFRWILNLEGDYFHKSRLETEIFDTQNVITLQGGEYYFRTGVRSNSNLQILRSGGGADDFTFNRIGAVVRASLYLQPRQSVFMKWVHEGEERVVTLTKSTREGVRHEIYIEHTPLFDYNTDDLERHDELQELYKIMPEFLNEMDRFTLTPFSPNGVSSNDGDFGTPSIPCQVMRLDDPDGD